MADEPQGASSGNALPDGGGQAQARARADNLARSFLAVFGPNLGRTTAQSLVLDHLRQCAGSGENLFRFQEADRGRDGIAVLGAGIHRDGAQSLIRLIERQLLLADNLGKQKPATAKPAVKRSGRIKT